MREPFICRELPPTAGLPLYWRDFFGPEGRPLEDGLVEFLGVPAVQLECSGTSGLVLAFEALKRCSPRRTVVLPGYTCPLVPLAAARAGLQIKLCDIRPDRFDFDLSHLSAISNSETLCIVPTHLGGLTTLLPGVLEIARRVGAYVIEDAAQALGATWNGRPVGTFGDIGIYSLACGKGLTLYEGGVLVARDESIRTLLRDISRKEVLPHRWMEWLRLAQLFGYRLFYNPLGLWLTYGLPLRRWLKRGDPIRAVGDRFDEDIPIHPLGAWRKEIGAAALERLPAALASQRERARDRILQLSKIAGLRVIEDLPEATGTWPFIMVLFDSASACRRALSRLWPAGLGVTRLFVHPLTGYPQLEEIVPRASLPHAESFAARCLTITNSPWLTEPEFQSIWEVLADSAATPERRS
ncbi:MAG: DegT/DnrJ/EryC1/StrS family aminotransferase [Nitrospirae bacterium]|nr:DegT/DnrJ/EryC1/StrS family aminotransferase [Candidatus Manganitrophaceae bacterium]